MNPYILLSVAIVAEVIATTALRATEGFTRWLPSLLVVAGYSISFYFLSLTLKTISVGVSYAIWSGVGTVLIAVQGFLVYGQKVDLPAAIGIALIIAGVIVMNLFSQTTVH